MRVKDELDILPYTFDHLVSEGVTGILLCDNLSQDGTMEWMGAKLDWWYRNFVEAGFEMDVFIDTTVGYYQSAQMTTLVDEAFERGATWVLPIDADECWYSSDGRRLSEVFRTAPEQCDILKAQLHNYYPTGKDRVGELNPYRRITHRDPEPAPLPKVAVSRRGLIIEQGNHDATGYPNLIRCPSPLVVGHFPWRSPEQFQRKIENGSAAYAAAPELPGSYGTHWREYGEVLEQQGPEALRAIYDSLYFEPDIELEMKPVPWVGVIS